MDKNDKAQSVPTTETQALLRVTRCVTGRKKGKEKTKGKARNVKKADTNTKKRREKERKRHVTR
jgi:hypothetical protein